MDFETHMSLADYKTQISTGILDEVLLIGDNSVMVK